MINIVKNLHYINNAIQQAADLSCYQEKPQLLAVSKQQPKSVIESAFHAGQRHFGENYMQEGLEKIQALQHLPITWHFIGALQSNKTRSIAEHFDWVHTIDRTKIAQRLNDQRPPNKPALNVCLQVNIDDDKNKSGINPSEVESLALNIAKMPNLALRGLMAIPAIDPSNRLESFLKMRQLYEDLRHLANFAHIDTLSMGMSNDMTLAIKSGSTMVRIGSALFGERH